MQAALTDITLQVTPVYVPYSQGKRTGVFIVDVKDPSDMPSITEPFFQVTRCFLSASLRY